MVQTRRYARGFWAVAYTFTVLMASTTLPTPLYPLYQRAEGFGPLLVTVVFAGYAVGVLGMLIVGGHQSDRIGRRPVLFTALAVAAVSDLVFLASTALPVLLLARVLSGLSIGLAAATATAYLADLAARAWPRVGGHRAGIVATAANLGGLGLGPLLAGLLAEHVAAPLRTPYLVSLGLLGLGWVAVALAPETVPVAGGRRLARPLRLGLPPGHRRVFTGAALAAVAAFALLGLFTSLAPVVLSQRFATASPTVAGVAALLVFGAAAGTQIALGGWRRHGKLRLGYGSLAAGLVLLPVGVWSGQLVLFLAGGVIAGAGAGVAYQGGLATVLSLADPERRGSTATVLFIAGYVGLSVPMVGLGAATQAMSVGYAVAAFAAAMLVLVAVAARWTRLG